MAILEVTYRLAPGHGDLLYLVVPYGVFLGFLVFGARQVVPRLKKLLAAVITGFRESGLPTAMAVAFLTVGLAFTILVGSVAPLDGNDALEYAHAARLVYRQRSISGYPFLDSTVSGGYYGPWTHPPGYVLRLVWGYLTAGNADALGIGKIAAGTSLAQTVLVAGFAARRMGRSSALLAAALTLGTPLLVQLAVKSHIDPGRLPAWLLAFALAGELARRASFSIAVLFGLALAAAMYGHSIGILAPPLASASYLLLARDALGVRLRVLSVANGVATGLLAAHFWRNWRDFGAPVADFAAVPVYQLEKLGYADWFKAIGGSETWGDRLLRLARLFHSVGIFGLGPATALMGTLLRRPLRLRFEPEIAALFWGAAGYLGLAIATSLAGSDAFVKNDRYLVTVVPMLAVVGGVAMARILTKVENVLRTFPSGRPYLVPIVAVAAVSVLTSAVTPKVARTHWLSLKNTDPAFVRPYDSPQFRAVAFARKALAEGGCALVFRQGDFANYTETCWLSHIDPRLLPVYEAESVEAAQMALERLGLTHVVLPPYDEPAWTMSALVQLLKDPTRAELIADFDGYRWLRLRRMPLPATRWVAVPLAPEEALASVWERTENGLALRSNGDERGRLRSNVPFTVAETGERAPWTPDCRACDEASDVITPQDDLLLEATIRGAGARLQFHWLCYQFEHLVSSYLVWEGAATASWRSVGAQFRSPTYCTAQQLRVTLSRPATTELRGLVVLRRKNASAQTSPLPSSAPF
jgi:hypothetical protein